MDLATRKIVKAICRNASLEGAVESSVVRCKTRAKIDDILRAESTGYIMMVDDTHEGQPVTNLVLTAKGVDLARKQLGNNEVGSIPRMREFPIKHWPPLQEGAQKEWLKSAALEVSDAHCLDKLTVDWCNLEIIHTAPKFESRLETTRLVDLCLTVLKSGRVLRDTTAQAVRNLIIRPSKDQPLERYAPLLLRVWG